MPTRSGGLVSGLGDKGILSWSGNGRERLKMGRAMLLPCEGAADAADAEIAVKAAKDDDRGQQHYHRDGHDGAPVGSVLLEEGLQSHRQGELLSGSKEDDRDQVVVPADQEAEDGRGQHTRKRVPEN